VSHASVNPITRGLCVLSRLTASEYDSLINEPRRIVAAIVA